MKEALEQVVLRVPYNSFTIFLERQGIPFPLDYGGSCIAQNKALAEHLYKKGYSQKTIKNYLHHIKKFLVSKKTPREYLLTLIEKNKSDETVRSAGFAIKFYLKTIKEGSSDIENLLNDLPNVKREKKLPLILSKEEIEQLIMATKNINHRLIIQIGYSAGFRISEIINLKWEDIDFNRNLIHIKRAKGKKIELLCFHKKSKRHCKHSARTK